ncbi:MAG: hypothetical protein M3R17_18160 [Bacteroidota bacterium]|nr:hypothetical protein [Bacteroidota bacterium]
MGLSIHYNGQFRKGASLEGLIEELEDISKIYNWEYHVFEKKFPTVNFDKNKHDGKLYGICFTPLGCETIAISFLSNGKMSGPAQLQLYGNSNNIAESEYLYMLFTKTQYAGSEIHMLIIHLLKYLNTKYFTDFKLIDEGQYWETGDKKLLRETFKNYEELIEAFSSSLKTMPMNSSETIEVYLERLMTIINKKNKSE